ncbi:hypothetical protein H0H93_004068 [Arthromyces matolae]|nr:hypothetical protein H0H93_004068 [Arthromyces matolae]
MYNYFQLLLFIDITNPFLLEASTSTLSLKASGLVHIYTFNVHHVVLIKFCVQSLRLPADLHRVIMPAFVASTSTFNIETENVLPLPIRAVTNTTRTPPSTVPLGRDPLDGFFGYTLSTTPTHESRHDDDSLPAYIEDVPPTYTLKAPEPVTLAKYLFKFGFLFPPFWIIGAWILWSPLRAPSSDSDAELAWMADKTEFERERVIADMRKAEVRWALRCLWALLILILLGAIAGIVIWAVLHS